MSVNSKGSGIKILANKHSQCTNSYFEVLYETKFVVNSSDLSGF